MKLRITYRELSILAGIMVAVVAILMLWFNEISGSLSILPSLSSNDIPYSVNWSDLKIVVSSAVVEVLH